MFIQLKDRMLCVDGDSVYESSSIFDILNKYDVKYVTELTTDIVEYNNFVSETEQIQLKTHISEMDITWNIPDQYKNLDIKQYLIDKVVETQDNIELEIVVRRINEELALYEHKQLVPVLQALVYIVNTLRANNCVWGIGRGSCVSSYILYLIGVHDVNSILYDLDITDFLNED